MLIHDLCTWSWPVLSTLLVHAPFNQIDTHLGLRIVDLQATSSECFRAWNCWWLGSKPVSVVSLSWWIRWLLKLMLLHRINILTSPNNIFTMLYHFMAFQTIMRNLPSHSWSTSCHLKKKEHDVNACSVLPCQNDITVVRERTTRDLTTTRVATGILHSYRQVVMGPNIVFNDWALVANS